MSVVRRLMRLMRPKAGWMALAVFASAMATAAHVALMATSGWFITAMALAGLAGASMNYFTPAAMIRAFAILRTAGRYAERTLGHEATLRFVAWLRVWLFGRIERAAPAALGRIRDGDVLTRLRADVDRMELAFLRVVSPLSAGVLVVAPVVLWLALRRPSIAAVLGFFAIGGGLSVSLVLLAASRRPAADAVEAAADLNSALVEAVEGGAELAVYDPNGLRRATLLAHSDRALGAEDRLARVRALGEAAIPALAHLSVVALLAIGVPALREGSMPPAELPMLSLLGVALFDAVAGWPLAFQTLPLLRASAERVFQIADREPAFPEPLQSEEIEAPLTLRFDQASFRHEGALGEGLRDLELTLRSGRRIAILGPSGSGKSTLAALAMRFLAPQRGRVMCNGHDYARLSGERLRRHVALLAQDDHVFSGTIRENLRLADPQASQAALERACRTARILALIESLPDGFETWVGAHGRALSGGEARRLLLARALLRRPDILILDEPTEGLNPQTENEVMDAILADHPDAGVLLLTHRRAGLCAMDEVYRLEAGRLVVIDGRDLAAAREVGQSRGQ
jgi:ATP-binding cassette subfamily C protein CydC